MITQTAAHPAPGERCDFFYRVRDTAEFSKWRSQLVDRVMREYRTCDLPRVRAMLDVGTGLDPPQIYMQKGFSRGYSRTGVSDPRHWIWANLSA